MPQELLGHKDWVLGLSQTPDGKTLVSGDDKGEVIVWDRPTGKEVRRWKLKGWAWGLGVSPDGQAALISERIPLVFDSGSRSGLKLWNVQTGTIKADLGKEIKERMAAAAYSPDGKWLAVCRGGEANGLSGKVTLLDPATGKKIRETSPGHLDGADRSRLPSRRQAHLLRRPRHAGQDLAAGRRQARPRPRQGPRRPVQGLDLRHRHLPRRQVARRRRHGRYGADLVVVQVMKIATSRSTANNEEAVLESGGNAGGLHTP